VTRRLDGKIAIVTGGARGIGGQIAAAFAAEGADVVIADLLGAAAAAPVLSSIARSGQRSLLVRTDVSDERQVRAMVDAAHAEFGQVDILVNDAGIVSHSAFADLEVSEWDRVIAVNLRGDGEGSHAPARPHYRQGRARPVTGWPWLAARASCPPGRNWTPPRRPSPACWPG
jgi:NAD(P)-dependent dehydrogenase (short-subunit alcohol dehydrogenase family)